MANAWDVTDSALANMLTAWKLSHDLDPDWHVNLYKNDYTPVPGSVIGDYTPADFSGYAEQDFSFSNFDPVFVADHVAILAQPDPNTFTRDGTAGAGQTVYGYYVTDDNDVYQWGERFEEPRLIMPFDSLDVTVRMLHRVYVEPA